jgi:hypothetical protein
VIGGITGRITCCLALPGLLLCHAPASASDLFAPARNDFRYGIHGSFGPFANGIEAVDMDRDGNLDLVACDGAGLVEVFPGRSNGTFGAPRGVEVESTEASPPLGGLVVADVDGDLYMDIIVTHYDAFGLKIFRGSEQGLAKQPEALATPAWGVQAGAGDVTGDGRPEIAVTTFDSLYLYVNLGDGDFGAAELLGNIDLATQPQMIDIDADGRKDIVCANRTHFSGPGSVSIWFNEIEGFIRTQIPLQQWPGFLDDIQAVDMNGDSRPDLVVLSKQSQESRALTYLQNLDGSFAEFIASEPLYPTVQGRLSTGDYDGDGSIDVALAQGQDLAIFLNDGTGALEAPIQNTGLNYIDHMRSADVNQDGHIDILLQAHFGTIRVELGDGQGHFSNAWSPVAPPQPRSVELFDLTGDGYSELIALPATGDLVSAYLGNGTGTFSAPLFLATGLSASSALGLKAVGAHGDLAFADSMNGQISLLPGLGELSFGVPLVRSTGPGPLHLGAGDWDGDSRDELILVEQLSEKGLSLADSTSITPGAVAVRVLESTKEPSRFAVMNSHTELLHVFGPASGGGFEELLGLPTGADPVTLDDCDVNADGRPDLLVANAGDSTLSIYLSDSQVQFLDPLTLDVPARPLEARFVKISPYERQDIVVLTANPPGLSVFRFQPPLGWALTEQQALPGQPLDLAADHLDENLLTDLVLADPDSGAISVLINHDQTVGIAFALTSLSATRSGTGVALRWTLLEEGRSASCRVYREGPDETRRDLSGTFSGRQEYNWTDATAPADAHLAYWIQVIHRNGAVDWFGPVRVVPLEVSGPGPAVLSASSNPFSTGVALTVEIRKLSQLTIDVFDIRGRLIRALVNHEVGAGCHMIWWDGRTHQGSPVPAGVYFVRASTGGSGRVVTGKLVKLP